MHQYDGATIRAPEPSRVVVACTQDLATVGAERHSVHGGVVMADGRRGCRRDGACDVDPRIPQPRGAVVTSSHERPTVGTERRVVHGAVVPDERGLFETAIRSPEVEVPVAPAREYGPAVRHERDRLDAAEVALEHSDDRAIGQTPRPADRVSAAGRGEHGVVSAKRGVDYVAGMTERVQKSSGLRVPDPNERIVTGSRDQRAVVAEPRAVQETSSLEFQDLLLRRDVEDAREPIPSDCQQTPTVGAERHGANAFSGSCGMWKDGDRQTRSHVPQP